MIPLFGHDEAVAGFRAALAGGRLHHAWLITGPRGVGKGTFARAAALRLLAEAAGPAPGAEGLQVEPDHPTAKLVAASSHPDLHVLKREPWAGKPPNEYIIPENERSGDEELARSIRIKQIRMLGAKLSLRPALSDRRAIIIDAADELEPAAANALLKSLEEPPAGTVFLLVSHSPERLLPTVRSRCRQLRLKKLDETAMKAALAAALPEADEQEIKRLAAAGEGCPGQAVAFHGLEIDALDRALEELAAKGDPTNARRSQLAQSLALKAAQPRYEAFLSRAPSLIAAKARERRGEGLADAIRLWQRAQDLAGGAVRLSLEPQAVVFELAGLVAALAPHPAPAARGEGRLRG